MKILYIPATFLFIAIFGLPYNYYTFLRFVVTGVSLYAAFGLLEKGNINFWVMLFIAILFNPLIPIYLSKDTWILINIITGSYFTVTAYINGK
tara:strand:- start:284 stop:562 length:279 start_codon:yes stop_codon:yes gene_type:complete